MTKADMIETLVTETLEKREAMKLYEKAFGNDSRTTQHASSEWATMYDMICKLGLEKQYIWQVQQMIEARIAEAGNDNA